VISRGEGELRIGRGLPWPHVRAALPEQPTRRESIVARSASAALRARTFGIEATIERTGACFGRLDAAYNNAGVKRLAGSRRRKAVLAGNRSERPRGRRDFPAAFLSILLISPSQLSG
jgi:NAD(P)-dependent dehydrogenase (short-subunit alcohol dehydrogenase family)